jgi:hypothetical protein
MLNCYCSVCKRTFVVEVDVPGLTGETYSQVERAGCLLCGPMAQADARIMVLVGPHLGKLRKPEPAEPAPEWWDRTMH